MKVAIVAAAMAATLIACGSRPARKAEAGSASASAASGTDPYGAEIKQFQQEHEAALKADTGWLTIAGLWFLAQPHTTFGSDPANDIVLPASAPPHAGRFDLQNGQVTVVADPGVTFTLGTETFTTKALKSDADGPPDRFKVGNLQLWVHISGARPSIRLRDPDSPLRTAFKGTTWFPIDTRYRVEGEWHPYAKAQTIQVPNILGDIDDMTVPGEVSFTLDGKTMKMMAIDEGKPNELWFIFRDLTSGHETYPAARFIYLPGPQNGKMIVDFNRAENPPCAYNPYSTCPLPPPENRLPIRIEAGEKVYQP